MPWQVTSHGGKKFLRRWVSAQVGAASQLIGRDSNQSCKGAPHGIRAPKAAGDSNLFEAAICSLQLLTSGFDSRL
jgi:hypothetical protein